LKSNIVKDKVTIAQQETILIPRMVLCLVTLTDLQTRRAGLSATAEVLVLPCDAMRKRGLCCGPVQRWLLAYQCKKKINIKLKRKLWPPPPRDDFQKRVYLCMAKRGLCFSWSHCLCLYCFSHL